METTLQWLGFVGKIFTGNHGPYRQDFIGFSGEDFPEDTNPMKTAHPSLQHMDHIYVSPCHHKIEKQTKK